MNESVRIKKITKMEQKLNSSSKAVENLADALNNYILAREDINDLAAYYHSPEWIADYDADNRGEFPQNLGRGVLSQDAIYNLLTENDRILKLISSQFNT